MRFANREPLIMSLVGMLHHSFWLPHSHTQCRWSCLLSCLTHLTPKHRQRHITHGAALGLLGVLDIFHTVGLNLMTASEPIPCRLPCIAHAVTLWYIWCRAAPAQLSSSGVTRGGEGSFAKGQHLASGNNSGPRMLTGALGFIADSAVSFKQGLKPLTSPGHSLPPSLSGTEAALTAEVPSWSVNPYSPPTPSGRAYSRNVLSSRHLNGFPKRQSSGAASRACLQCITQAADVNIIRHMVCALEERFVTSKHRDLTRVPIHLVCV